MDPQAEAWRRLSADPAGPDLWRGALLVARDEGGGADEAAADVALERLTRRIARRLQALPPDEHVPDAFVHALFVHEDFRGSESGAFDPADSDVTRVLARRRGLPIALATIAQVVAARCAVPLHGIGFPGRFLLGALVDGRQRVFDPVEGGRVVEADELAMRAAAHAGGEAPDAATLARLLAPASARGTLLRMLRNLKAGHVGRDDWAAVLRICDRQLLLAPELPDALRDRGLAWLELGQGQRAAEDLERFLARHPDADGAPALRRALEQARRSRVRLH